MTLSADPVTIRPVRPEDVPAVVAMVHELAEDQNGVHGIYLEDLYVRPAARQRRRTRPAGALVLSGPAAHRLAAHALTDGR